MESVLRLCYGAPMNRSTNSHFNPWLTLVVVCFAQFMVILDATVVNVALPSIQTDLAISDTSLQWIVNGYTLLFGGFLLLGGRAADLIGRRRLFVAGVVIFSAASLINGLATSGEMLIGARALQGFGAALVSPAALSIITTTFAEGAERTKALAVWGAIAAGGAAAGLLLGGVLTEFLSWEWVFFVNVPIGVAVVIAALRLVPESRAEGAVRHFDLAGATAVTSGLIVLVYAIVKAETWGWTSVNTLGLIGVAAALLAAFVAIERRSHAPLVRLDLFRLRSLATANGVMVLVVAGMYAMFFISTLYLQNVLGYSALETGLGFLPISAGIIIGSGLAQQLINRAGVKPVLVTGMSITAVGLAVLAATTAVDGTYLGLLGGLLPMAIGMGLTFVPLTLVGTTNVEKQDAGLASGVFNTSQQVGGALGLAILSTIASDRTASVLAGFGDAPSPHQQSVALVDGFQLAFVVAAVLVAAGAALTASLLRRRDVARIDTTEPVLVGA
jgi:EmrB/QacA subfamily drug resistance transporter